MKLDQTTLNVLKNFATNNSNLVIKAGNKIETVSEDSSLLAFYTSEQTFEKQVSIYNLNEFLGVLSIFDKPELDLKDNMMTISNERQNVKYVYADPTHLLTPTDKVRVFPETKITFTLSDTDLSNLKKMSAVLGVSDFTVLSEGSTIKLKVYDKKNPSSNNFIIDTMVECDSNFSANFKIDKLKFYTGTYRVDISEKRIARFTNTAIDLFYLVLMEADSKF